MYSEEDEKLIASVKKVSEREFNSFKNEVINYLEKIDEGFFVHLMDRIHSFGHEFGLNEDEEYKNIKKRAMRVKELDRIIGDLDILLYQKDTNSNTSLPDNIDMMRVWGCFSESEKGYEHHKQIEYDGKWGWL